MSWTLARGLALAGVAAVTISQTVDVGAGSSRAEPSPSAALVLFDPVRSAAPVRAEAVQPSAPAPRWTHRQVLDAIRAVESSLGEDTREGDDGRAVGPYQIWDSYWSDAVESDPSLAWIGSGAARRRARHGDCRDLIYAERVVRAFMLRYARAAWERFDAETIARVHNGGPRGAQRASTLAYWARVEAALR